MINRCALLRLGILPTGFIYPKQMRAVRDVLRLRLLLVKQKISQLLSCSACKALSVDIQANASLAPR
jgi:transposase